MGIGVSKPGFIFISVSFLKENETTKIDEKKQSSY